MTAAVITLAILCAALAAPLVALVYRHVRTVEGQAAADLRTNAAMRDLADERDRWHAEAVESAANYRSTDATLQGVARQLAAAREEIADGLRKTLVGADDDHVAAVVAGLLRSRADAMSRRAEAASADRGESGDAKL